MQTRQFWLWLVPVLLMSFWLGVHYMDARPAWLDEINSLKDAGDTLRSPVEIWNEVAVRNPWHPPGFFVILNGWERLVGFNPPALRVLSLLFGLLAIAFTYRLGRDHVTKQVGLYAAVLLGTGVMFTFYLDQIRVYTLLTLLSTFTLWIYLRIVRSPAPRRRDWLLLLAGVTAILYSHYFGAAMLAAIGLYHLIFVPKTRRWRAVVGVFAAGGLLFLPWAGVLLEALRRLVSPQEYNARFLSNGEVIEALATLFSNGLIVLLVAVLALSLLSRLRGGWRMWFFAASILISLLAINAVARVIPMSRLRYLLISWPIFSVLAAMGIVWLGQQGRLAKVASLLVLLLWAGTGIANVDNPALISRLGGGASYFPYQRVVRQLRDRVNEDDAIIAFWPAKDFSVSMAEYYGRQFPTRPVMVAAREGEIQSVDLKDFSKKDRLWVAYVPALPIGVPESFDQFRSQLSRYYQCDRPTDAADLTIELYARSAVCCGPGAAPLAHFGDGSIALTGLEQVTTSDSAQVTLGWSLAPTVPNHVFSVTLQIFDESGEKVGQNDYGLPAHSFACRTTAIRLPSLAPGQYTIRAGVYYWQTGQRLQAQSDDGTSGDLITIGSISLPQPS